MFASLLRGVRANNDDAPPPPVQHIYGRVSADEDGDHHHEAGVAGDGGWDAWEQQHGPRHGRLSAPASCGGGGGGGGNIGDADNGTATAAAVSRHTATPTCHSGPLPRVPSLLLGDAGPTAEAPTAAAAAATLEGQGSFSALAAEERWPLPLDNDRATNTAGAAASASAAAAPSAAPAAAALTPEQIALGEALAADEAAAEERRRRHAAAGPSGRAAPAGHDVAVDGDHDDDDDDGDFAGERRELLIYALPLTREKVAFLPVATFREEAPPPPPAAPEAAAARSGIGGFVKARVRAALDEASEAWEGLKAAEDGTFRHRLFKLGQRLLDSVPAEERLMRGLPRRVDRVAVFHATRLDSAALRAQMSSMSTAYGVKAVGKAAAATVLLPLAIGVDLIILPGPQVLTYYTSWQLWRNATGAAGAWQRAAFVTQSGDGGGGGGSGGGGGVRVEFVPDPRLDRAHDATGASRDGVLPEEEISALVAALREPSLEEPLRELRRQRLRKGGRAAADGAGRYAPLPTAGGGGGGGGAALDDDDDDDDDDGVGGVGGVGGDGGHGGVGGRAGAERAGSWGDSRAGGAGQEQRRRQEQQHQQHQQQRQPSAPLIDID